MFCPQCGQLTDENGFCSHCQPKTETTQKGFFSRTFVNTDNKLWCLFLAVFLAFSTFIPQSLSLAARGNGLSNFEWVIVSILLYFLSSLMMVIYFKKSNESESLLKRIINALIITIITFLLLYACYTVFGLIVSALSGTLISLSLNTSPLSYLLLVLYFFLSLFLMIFLISGVIFYYFAMESKSDLMGAGSIYRQTLARVFKKLPYILLVSVFSFLYIVFGSSLLNALMGVLVNVFSSAFLFIFIKTIISTLFNTYLVYVLFNCARFLLNNNELTIKKSKIPVFAVSLLIPVAIVLIFFNTRPTDPYKVLLNEIGSLTYKGDLYIQAGQGAVAVKEYESAYSRVLAAKGYFSEIIRLRKKDSPYTGGEDLKQASYYDPFNPYTDLFKGNILLFSEDYKGALKQYKNGTKNSYFHPELYLGAIKTFNEIDDDENKPEFLEWLIRNEVYSSVWDSYYKKDTNSLKDYVDTLTELSKELEQKLAYKSFLEATKGNYRDASGSLTQLQQKYPDSELIAYLLSQLYLEYRSEQSYYGQMVGSTEKLIDLVTKNSSKQDERLAKLYLASVYMSANDAKKAMDIYKELFEENSKDLEAIEGYSYTLLRNGDYDGALKVIEDSANDEIQTLNLVYYKAMVLLNKGDHEGSLKAISNIESFGKDYSEAYDRYLYAYSLAYANSIRGEEQISLIDSLGKSIIKPYILAMNEWRKKDTEKSNTYLNEVVASDSRLGYAYYCMGINEYEKAIRENTNKFDKAIEAYHKAMAIVPNHVELYFSMAHCYNKAGMNEEALYAFRKVVDLLPFQDHRTDPYGMTVHALGEISRLLPLVKEGK